VLANIARLTLEGAAPAADADEGTFRFDTPEAGVVWPFDMIEAHRLGAPARLTLAVKLIGEDGVGLTPRFWIDWGDGFADDSFLLPAWPGDYYAVERNTDGRAIRALKLTFDEPPGPVRIASWQVDPKAAPAPRPSLKFRIVQFAWRMVPEPVRMRFRPLARRYGLRLSARGTPTGRMAAPESYQDLYDFEFARARKWRSPHYAAPALTPPRRGADAPKVLAFHLPQFHAFPENEKWWGPGFTEWTNVAKAVPQFVGHQQPRRPADLGYYDLRVADTLRKQAQMAATAGVDAFCFHYYWFAGKRLMEKPLDLFAFGGPGEAAVDFPFALCWANENWTRRWDGAESEVLIAQDHSPADDIAVLEDLARYMRLDRYIKVDGKPLLVLYRPAILPDAAATVARWREHAANIGLPGLYILGANSFGFSDYEGFGLDGVVEFPPHTLNIGEITEQVIRYNRDFSGRVYDYVETAAAVIDDLASRRDPAIHPGVMPMWDNEARRPGAGHVFHNNDPGAYRAWLATALETSLRLAPPERRLVFVNAWNEWAEGAYLEPDQWYGHAMIQATRSAVESLAPRLTLADVPKPRTSSAPRGEAVALLHIFYLDMAQDLARKVTAAGFGAGDIIVTFPDGWSAEDAAVLRKAFPSAILLPQENRGRDVLPFLTALDRAKAEGYQVFCKLHSKRSPHLADGVAAGQTLIDAVLSGRAAAFEADPKLGLLAPASARVRLGENASMVNNAVAVRRLADLIGEVPYGDATSFPGGSMFWGRVAAFEGLLKPKPHAYGFEPEMGRIDGTVAHAVERLFAALPESRGYKAEWTL
jgi:lipopolysaccharide biosynthesis protein